MKKIAFAISTLIPSLLLTTPAFADSGFYAEISGGSVKNKAEVNYSVTGSYNYLGETYTETETGKESSSDKSTSFGLRLGYQFNDYIAVELGHHQYGEVGDNYVDEYGDTINDKVNSSSFSAGVKAILPITDEFSMFARAGMAKWDFKAKSTDSSIPDEALVVKQGDNDIYYGIGVEYGFTETISLGVEYSVLDMGWKTSEAGAYQDFSFSGNTSVNYKVENIALLLKISF